MAHTDKGGPNVADNLEAHLLSGVGHLSEADDMDGSPERRHDRPIIERQFMETAVAKTAVEQKLNHAPLRASQLPRMPLETLVPVYMDWLFDYMIACAPSD